MALTNSYVQVYGQLPDFFAKLSEGQAPDRFTRQHLKDLGFTKTSHHTLIPLMKTLGFLSSDGTPTSRYHEYRDASQSRRVMGDALREANSDLFVIMSDPKNEDRALIEGKFKSTHNCSEKVSKFMTATFFSLLQLADLDQKALKPTTIPKLGPKSKAKPESDVETTTPPPHRPIGAPPGLHYNIQIHLPATKDIEVFNAIFKSLREHLVE